MHHVNPWHYMANLTQQSALDPGQQVQHFMSLRTVMNLF